MNLQRSSGEMSSDASIGVPLHIESSSSSSNTSSGAEPSSDSKKQRWQKFIFVCTIILIALVSTTLTIIFAARQSDEEFYDLAKDLSNNFKLVFKNKVLNAKALAQSVASDAKYYNVSWPNVIIPGFNARCFTNFEESEKIIFAPLVTNATLKSWLSYVNANQEISATSTLLEMRGAAVEDGLQSNGRNKNSEIYRYGKGDWKESDTCSGPCFVAVQTSSNLWTSENAFLNLYSYPGLNQLYIDLIQNKSDQIGAYMFGDKNVTTIVYPISNLSDDATNGSIVGAVQVDIDFESSLKSIALSFKGAASVAVKIATGTMYWFDLVTGNGIVDTYDPEKPENCGYQSDGRCFYWLKVYKANEITDSNTTVNPFIITIIVASILNIVAIVIYLFRIERRRSMIKQNNHIIDRLSSLVRTKNGDENQESTRQAQSENGDSVIPEPAKTRLRTFLRESERTAPEYEDLVPYKYDAPIADLFPETTVMFADIAGFTAWSSEREPSQIFYLLESVYRTFDSLATKFGVFKVETIGDCYVAVAGIPDPTEVSHYSFLRIIKVY